MDRGKGGKVFERKTGGVLLTDAGKRVIKQAHRVLAGAERVKSIAESGRHLLAGVLRMGVIPAIAPYLLPDLVQALRGAAPQMPLDIEENLTANWKRCCAPEASTWPSWRFPSRCRALKPCRFTTKMAV